MGLSQGSLADRGFEEWAEMQRLVKQRGEEMREGEWRAHVFSLLTAFSAYEHHLFQERHTTISETHPFFFYYFSQDLSF